MGIMEKSGAGGEPETENGIIFLIEKFSLNVRCPNIT